MARQREQKVDGMAAVHTQGQRHDRILSADGEGESDTNALHLTSPPATVRTAADPETSITQKMLSAVTGSILTSLLGITLMDTTFTYLN